LETESRKTSN